VGKDLSTLYSNRRWRTARKAFLRLHPRCQAALHEPACGRLSEVVDHIVPRSAGGSTWARSNWQALSKPCHDAKTRREQAARAALASPAVVLATRRTPQKAPSSALVTEDYSVVPDGAR